MANNEEISQVTEVEETRPVSAENKKQENEKKAQNKKNKKSKEKKPSKIAKALKETNSELKKVTWPKFGTVVKQTGVVLLVTMVFLAVVFGIDRLCSWLVGFII